MFFNMCYPKIAEILETQDSTRKTVSAEVHPIPPDVNLDLEIKMEKVDEEEEERLGEESEHQDKEDTSAERAAAALLLLSQPKKEIPYSFSSLWEGTFFCHKFHTVKVLSMHYPKICMNFYLACYLKQHCKLHFL